MSRGPYLSPSRLSPNCSPRTKAVSEETSPPPPHPRTRWSAFRAPPDPSGPWPIWQGLRVLRARQATQHNNNLRSSCGARNHAKPDYLWESGLLFSEFLLRTANATQGHALRQQICRLSLAFNEECNLWGTKQEEWKRLDVVRPDWFDCNYDKPPNTSSALAYLIWPYLNCWSLFQHRAPGNCNSQTCKWGACVAPTYSILDLLLRISSVNTA